MLGKTASVHNVLNFYLGRYY